MFNPKQEQYRFQDEPQRRNYLDAFRQDLRFGARLFFRKPLFTLIAILTLALGIGVNTIIFSGVYAILFRPLPYKDSPRIVSIWSVNKQTGREAAVSYRDFTDLLHQSRSLENPTAIKNWSINLQDGDRLTHVEGALVSENFFALLGEDAATGRVLSPFDHISEHSNVAVIGYSLWQRQFAGRTNVVGKTVKINSKLFTIIGVAPASFQYPTLTELWVPMNAVVDTDFKEKRGYRACEVLAAVRSNTTKQQTLDEMNGIAQRLSIDYPDSNSGVMFGLASLQEVMSGKLRAPLYLLQFSICFVLLIACANIANLLLAHAATRQKEFAVRLAMGASRSRIVRQLLTESMLLGLLGGGLGLLLAHWGIYYLSSTILTRVPKLSRFGTIELDAEMLAFTLVISLLVSLIFGLVPALAASRPDLNLVLKEGSRSASNSLRHRRLRDLFVISEFVMAFVLLVSAGLMIRTFYHLQNVDPGFRTDNLLAMRITLPEDRFNNYLASATYFDQIRDKLAQLPGVDSVDAVSYLPLIGWNPGANFSVVDKPPALPEQLPRADYQAITPGYFRTIGMTLLRGREFTETEATESPEVVIVNETFARQYLANREPLGRLVKLGRLDSSSPAMVVIGVVKDIRQFGLNTEPRAEFYLPSYNQSMYLVVSGKIDVTTLTSDIRKEIAAVDKEQAAYNIRTMQSVLSDSLEKQRLTAILLTVLGVLALIMSAMGIYGVMAYAVSERTIEIGVRMAMGARPRDIIIMVMSQGIKLTLIGIVIGIIGALVMTKVMSNMIYGVSRIDPITFIAVITIFISSTLLACLLPAWRAAKIEPMEALRHE